MKSQVQIPVEAKILDGFLPFCPSLSAQYYLVPELVTGRIHLLELVEVRKKAIYLFDWMKNYKAHLI